MSKVKHSEPCPTCGHRQLLGGTGRHASITDDQIRSILEHFKAPQPKISNEKFCRYMGISTRKYTHVTCLRYKQPEDRYRVLKIASELGVTLTGGV